MKKKEDVREGRGEKKEDKEQENNVLCVRMNKFE